MGGQSRPNVVIVQTDDQNATPLGFMKNVQRSLADQGVTFTNYITTTPECCPSRASLLTGQYSHNNDVFGDDPPLGGFARLDGSKTLPVWLQRAGYRTAHVGRYLNHYDAPTANPHLIPPGWDDWQTPVFHTSFQMYGYTLNQNGTLVHYGHAPSDYETTVLTRKAVAFVHRNAGGRTPFFLSVDTAAPHEEGVLEGKHAPRNPRPAPRDYGKFAGRPLPRPPSFNEPNMADKPPFLKKPALNRAHIAVLANLYRSRLESLLAVDRLVGRLVAALRHGGQLDNTLFIFTSDNGFLLGQHRHHGKVLPYEESIKVPMVMRGPGIPPGVTRRQVVGNIDIAPTVVAATGAQPNLRMDGTSLLPIAQHAKRLTHRDLLLEHLVTPKYVGVRTPRYAYFRDLGYGADGQRTYTELYNLRRDPYELRNVAGIPRYSAIQSRLQTRLAALRHCAGASCRAN